jgi:hypothetical protein
LSNIDTSAVVIITRPPEIIACLKLRLATRNVFIIFDSHPRSTYPNGARIIVSPSIEGTARRLTELLPTVDLPDSFLQWQAQLLANYRGHVFVPHGVETSAPTLWQAVLETSAAHLSMQAEIAELRSQNESLKGEQQRLESEIKEAVAQSREQEMLIQQLQQQQQEQKRQNQQLRSSSDSQKYFDDSFASPRQFSSLKRRSSIRRSSRASTSTLNPFGPDSRSAGSSSSRAPHGRLGKPPTPPSDCDDSILSTTEARRLQNEFDTDRAISARLAELAKSPQRLFECGICMDEMPDDLIVRPDPCGHTFCRECLRGHVTARLNEHRFPILCPTCTAGKGKGKEAAGGTCCKRTVNFVLLSRCVSSEVSQSLALDLKLTEEQYSIWTEMEMASFSVLLSCRKYAHGICSPVSLLILG